MVPSIKSIEKLNVYRHQFKVTKSKFYLFFHTNMSLLPIEAELFGMKKILLSKQIYGQYKYKFTKTFSSNNIIIHFDKNILVNYT